MNGEKETVLFVVPWDERVGMIFVSSRTYPLVVSGNTVFKAYQVPMDYLYTQLEEGSYYFYEIGLGLHFEGVPASCDGVRLCEIIKQANKFNEDLVDALWTGDVLPSGTGWMGFFVLLGTSDAKFSELNECCQ